MDVYWLEQTESDVPAHDHWLGSEEARQLNTMRFAKRRADWRLGRWTAKRALAICLHRPEDPEALAGIEIRPAASGAPQAFLAGKPAALTISISHSAGTAACAVALSGAALGCDLEKIEERSEGFLADYFTAEEQALVAGAPASERSSLVAMLWSAKESALKALGEGLRLDTRSVVVIPADTLHCQDGEAAPACAPQRWRPLQVRYDRGQVFQGWWQCAGGLVRTMVADPPPAPPVLLG
jgi:4'-phosphopantetheinyl transferase